MLDRAQIRSQPDAVHAGLKRKGLEAPLEAFQKTDDAWRKVKSALDEANAQANAVSKTIGELIAQGKRDEAEGAKQGAAEFKRRAQELEDEERQLEAELKQIELQFPNLPHESVPDGKGPGDNPVIREFAEKPEFAHVVPPHWEIAAALDGIDFERGAKISGSGFVVYKGVTARLQRALSFWMAHHHCENNGYTEVHAPYLVNAESLVGTGNLPKFEDELYKVERDGLYLIPTSEVSVTNIYRDEVLDGALLPIKHVSFSPNFRREAGAAGAETRGIQRMHQFDKVELVNFTLPEQSYDTLERLTTEAESVLQELNLHYRVIELCTGDMGEKAAKAYDLEVWAPAEGRYLEVSTCANFEAYQARRAGIRFRRGPGAKPEHVHTLNGSGVAVPRLLVSILESNHMPDGRVKIPEVLRPYVGADFIEPAE